MTQMYLSTEQKQTQRHREYTCDWQREAGRGGTGWEFGVRRCKLLYTEWIKNNVPLSNTRNHGQRRMINHNGKEHKENVYITRPLCRRTEIDIAL